MARPRRISHPLAALRDLLLLVLLASIAACSAGAVVGDPAVGAEAVVSRARPIEEASALDPFFARLLQLENGGGAPLRIVQLGDSHTAGDVISGRLRSLLQQRFGAAGRGVMVPGKAYDGLRQVEVRVTQNGRWHYANSLPASSSGAFGITGFRAESGAAGAQLILESNEAAGFDRISVDMLRRPGGGRLDIAVDGRLLRRVSTAASETGVETLSMPVPPGSHQLTLTALDRTPVSLLAWGSERTVGDVVYDAHGVSGATIGLIARWDPAIAARELGDRQPALVVLAYGTNEAVQRDFDSERYAQQVTAAIQLVHRAAPRAAVLLVGPPDADVRPERCQGVAQSCAVAAQPDPASCRWRPAPYLATVSDIQRRVAAGAGAAFWDWSSVMGGACGAHRWATAEPPFARADHIHQTAAGYSASADALYQWLIDDYERYKLRHGGRPSPGRAG